MFECTVHSEDVFKFLDAHSFRSVPSTTVPLPRIHTLSPPSARNLFTILHPPILYSVDGWTRMDLQLTHRQAMPKRESSLAFGGRITAVF